MKAKLRAAITERDAHWAGRARADRHLLLHALADALLLAEQERARYEQAVAQYERIKGDWDAVLRAEIVGRSTPDGGHEYPLHVPGWER